jgi:MFS family permease
MTTQPTPKGAWRITFLLFLFMLVNFADKIVVGLAGVPIMTELKLEPEQFGLLGSSFFFLFSIAAIVVGFIVNRIATRWVLLALALSDRPSRCYSRRIRQGNRAFCPDRAWFGLARPAFGRRRPFTIPSPSCLKP